MTDKLISDLCAEVAAALEELDALMITVDFNSKDPDSVEAAIRTVEAIIDRTVAPYRAHPFIESTVANLKAECREGIYEHAKHAALVTPGITSKPTLH
ncbi:hypothetical protein [Caballeronia sp. Lep1P3]|uniref:hypothetical protein n=1 Tax=Caballeronia sp. Lep1P3 TaxID=2878150 RepID=UPI00025B9DAC|nr:hypothetical protein [Caballeronia sp. Lep1P3]EKS72769.1 hypothetical protein BURK_004932 [Burkholderia sp. SJ98]